MRRYGVLLFILLLSPPSGGVGLAALPGEKVEADEYEVYSALITALMEKRSSRGPIELVVLNERTAPIREPHHLSGLALREAYDDYRSKNSQPYPLERLFNLPVKYALVSYDEVKRLSAKEFDEQYPRALGSFIFSRVGFDGGRTNALVYVERRCGFSCAEASGYLLDKKDGAWKIKKRRFLWVS